MQLQACTPIATTWSGSPPPYGSQPFANRSALPGAGSYASTPSGLNASSLSDDELSRQLTDSLRHQRLPLVGADAYTDDHGNRRVVLYGYVATEAGKADAADKVRRLLNDRDIAISNRITVHPDLASVASAPRPQSSNPVPMDGIQAYENQGRGNPAYGNYSAPPQAYAAPPQGYAAQPQQIQQPPNLLSSFLPLLGMNSMGGLGGGGGAFSPYASPYASPLANPFAMPYSGASPGYPNPFAGFLP